MIERPFVVLLVGIVFVVVVIVGLRIHAFLALMFAAILVGLLQVLLASQLLPSTGTLSARLRRSRESLV